MTWSVLLRVTHGSGRSKLRQAWMPATPPAWSNRPLFSSTTRESSSLRTSGNTLFDSADVFFRIDQGTAKLDPIKLTGTAFSLQGKGIRDPQGNLDLRLSVLYGRDRFHLPVVSDLLREASGQIFIVHVVGPSANPKFTPEALPQVQRLGARRSQQIQD